MNDYETMMDRPLFYRMDGSPYPGTSHEQTLAWAKDFEDRANNGGFVAQETLPNGIYISTIWMGLDHNYGAGRPLIFETMVFGAKAGKDLDQDRYASLEEAKAGHAAMVKKYKAKS